MARRAENNAEKALSNLRMRRDALIIQLGITSPSTGRDLIDKHARALYFVDEAIRRMGGDA